MKVNYQVRGMAYCSPSLITNTLGVVRPARQGCGNAQKLANREATYRRGLKASSSRIRNFLLFALTFVSLLATGLRVHEPATFKQMSE